MTVSSERRKNMARQLFYILIYYDSEGGANASLFTEKKDASEAMRLDFIQALSDSGSLDEKGMGIKENDMEIDHCSITQDGAEIGTTGDDYYQWSITSSYIDYFTTSVGGYKITPETQKTEENFPVEFDYSR
jgi:hypothetical protein